MGSLYENHIKSQYFIRKKSIRVISWSYAPDRWSVGRAKLAGSSGEIHHKQNNLQNKHEELYHDTTVHSFFLFQPGSLAVPKPYMVHHISGQDWYTPR